MGYIAREVLGCEEVQKEVQKEVHKEVQKEVQKKVQKEVQKEVQKWVARFHKKICDLPKSKRIRSSLVGRVGGRKVTGH